MNILFKTIYQTFVIFSACFFFSITFNIPKRELIYCGFTGALGWFIYCVSVYMFDLSNIIGTFLAAIFLTYACRILSNVRQAPSTIYLIPGILPLVPGSHMYYTMYGILNGDMIYSYNEAVLTAKLAGVIAVGIIIVLSLPYSFFDIKNIIKKK